MRQKTNVGETQNFLDDQSLPVFCGVLQNPGLKIEKNMIEQHRTYL